MIDFARTVFGDDFDADSVVTESRLDLDEWAAGAADRVAALGLTPRRLARADLAGANAVDGGPAAGRRRATGRSRVLGALYDTGGGALAARSATTPRRCSRSSMRTPWCRARRRRRSRPPTWATSPRRCSPSRRAVQRAADEDERVTFLTHLVAALSHVRAVVGRAALSVDLHLWVRELTRIDRAASSARPLPVERRRRADRSREPTRPAGQHAFPAIYCRHCGRSGWGVSLAAVGSNLDTDDTAIRRNHAAHEGRFRALIYAPLEAEHAPPAAGTADVRRLEPSRGCAGSPSGSGCCCRQPPADDDPDYRDGWVLPVLTQVGPDADDDSRDDTCPSCQQKDGIRFLGSAIATLLSVTLSTMFGDEALDPREKKALVFTDSVQDAAHRAGFVQSRSHALTLRALLRHAVGEHPVALDSLVDQAIAAAGRRPVPPLPAHPAGPRRARRVRSVLAAPARPEVPARVRTRVRRRLLFDAVLEFGLQSRVGRTLEQTGSAVVEVDAGAACRARQHRPRRARRDRRPGHPRRSLATLPDNASSPGCAACWNACARRAPSSTSGSRASSSTTGTATTSGAAARAARACPPSREGRSAPAFPRIGPAAPVRDPLLDPVSTPAVLVRPLDRAGARRHRRPRRAAGPAAA